MDTECKEELDQEMEPKMTTDVLSDSMSPMLSQGQGHGDMIGQDRLMTAAEQSDCIETEESYRLLCTDGLVSIVKTDQSVSQSVS